MGTDECPKRYGFYRVDVGMDADSGCRHGCG